MKKNRIILLAILLVISLAISACGNDACTAHTDTNGDYKCDSCGAEIEKPACTEHTDANGD